MTKSKPKVEIVVVGSVAYDTIETPSARRKNLLGGSGTHFSLAASYGSRVGIVACVGNDFRPADRATLKRRHISMDGLETVKGKTFRWSGRYGKDPNMRETLALDLNVFSNFEPKVPADYLKAPCVFLGNIDPKLQAKVLGTISEASLIGCDTMNHWIEAQRMDLIPTLKRVDILVLNDEEARMLSKKESLMAVAKVLLSMGPKAVIIKRGENGCVVFKSTGFRILPAMLLSKVVDPTGAGDCFAGGLFSRLVNERYPMSLDALARGAFAGTVMASFSVEKFGVEGVASLTLPMIRKRGRELCKAFGMDWNKVQ